MTATALRAAAAGTFAPDAQQQRALAHDGRLLRVLGGPGTGKTTLAVELVADRVARGVAGPEQCLVL
ncbi:UvrD-helicase domain-containing protein, partial [Nostocoides australiense]|uniref:UvrD-helicase domain-containing protein n=1 Tax=Nostocoides australiense TaxID=99480 RepID=UPI00066186A6